MQEQPTTLVVNRVQNFSATVVFFRFQTTCTVYQCCIIDDERPNDGSFDNLPEWFVIFVGVVSAENVFEKIKETMPSAIFINFPAANKIA